MSLLKESLTASLEKLMSMPMTEEPDYPEPDLPEPDCPDSS